MTTETSNNKDQYLEPTKELAPILRDTDLEPQTANEIVARFAPVFNDAEAALNDAREIAVTDATQVSMMKRARESRLTLKDIRVRGDKIRKDLKQDALRKGQVIDAVGRRLKEIIEPVEQRLLECEQFAERAEAERKARIKAERSERLREFDADPEHFAGLDEMTDEQFEKILNLARKAQEERIEEERRAEAERKAKEQAEREEQERIRAENEKLKRERDQRAREAAEERRRFAEEKAEAERRADEERLRAERLENERWAREQAERERQEREAEERRLAAQAPDAEKLRRLKEHFTVAEWPEMETARGAGALNNVVLGFTGFMEMIDHEIDQLAGADDASDRVAASASESVAPAVS